MPLFLWKHALFRDGHLFSPKPRQHCWTTRPHLTRAVACCSCWVSSDHVRHSAESGPNILCASGHSKALHWRWEPRYQPCHDSAGCPHTAVSNGPLLPWHAGCKWQWTPGTPGTPKLILLNYTHLSIFVYLWIYQYPYGGFLKWGYSEIIHFDRIFRYKQSILGYPHFRKPYRIHMYGI